MARYRIETDSMGRVRVPADVYYGAQTQRAAANFPVSGYRFPRALIEAIGEIKRAAAEANGRAKRLEPAAAKAIAKAAAEVARGKLDDQFPLDVFQTGSGTSLNMNANEVVANRAAELLGLPIGRKKIHPNDHVNLGQSSNDLIPTAMHLALLLMFTRELTPALRALERELRGKSRRFDRIVKTGRTHLQDATPVRLGQVFGGYAAAVGQAADRIERTYPALGDLALGGTAVGTGINCPPGFAREVIAALAGRLRLNLREAPDHFAAQGGKDAVVEASGAVKSAAVALHKIANDVRHMASGPRCGLGEIRLPETQPGSSIMPGKVNPVIAESLIMVCSQIFGLDATVTFGGAAGNFELNTMMPVMAHASLESARLLSRAAENFRARCIAGLRAERKHCEDAARRSLALVTALVPRIGHDRAAALAREAHRTGETILEVSRRRKILPEAELKRLLDPFRMTGPSRR